MPYNHFVGLWFLKKRSFFFSMTKVKRTDFIHSNLRSEWFLCVCVLTFIDIMFLYWIKKILFSFYRITYMSRHGSIETCMTQGYFEEMIKIFTMTDKTKLLIQYFTYELNCNNMCTQHCTLWQVCRTAVLCSIFSCNTNEQFAKFCSFPQKWGFKC